MGFLVDRSHMGSTLLGGQGLSYILKFSPEDLGLGDSHSLTLTTGRLAVGSREQMFKKWKLQNLQFCTARKAVCL